MATTRDSADPPHAELVCDHRTGGRRVVMIRDERAYQPDVCYAVLQPDGEIHAWTAAGRVFGRRPPRELPSDVRRIAEQREVLP